MPGQSVGYNGWLVREEYRLLRQVEREVYPSIQEMEAERNRLRHRRRRPLQHGSGVVHSTTTPTHHKEVNE